MKHFINRLGEEGPGHNVPEGSDNKAPFDQIAGRGIRPNSLPAPDGSNLTLLVAIQRRVILKLAGALLGVAKKPSKEYLKNLIRECEGRDAKN